jgi:NAD(P)-dependent dehydrogenase (short-subunit alcohol dehydrogenase family)
MSFCGDVKRELCCACDFNYKKQIGKAQHLVIETKSPPIPHSAHMPKIPHQPPTGAHMQKSILITGCSSGIGYDAAHGLAARGWRVFATARQQADVDRLIGEGLESFRLDYADEASITAAVAETLNRTGGTLDALYNNGAFALPGALEDLPRGALRSIYETNLFGYHDLTRQIIPAMRAQGHGRIINCSSVLGLVGMKWRGAYVSTKFALEGLSDVLRIEMAGTGIHVILIEPGPITSRIRENSRAHVTRWIDWKNSARAEEYAPLIERLFGQKYGPDPFELPASAVTQKLIHALESPRPKARYFVTTLTYLMNIARRLLPTRWLDQLLLRR